MTKQPTLLPSGPTQQYSQPLGGWCTKSPPATGIQAHRLCRLLLFALAISSHFLQTSDAAAVDTSTSSLQSVHTKAIGSGPNEDESTLWGTPYDDDNGLEGPPIDFGQLGQIAFLGEFDALTPVLSSRQQNSYIPTSFSIVEIDTIHPQSPLKNISSTSAHIDPLSTFDSSSDTLPPITVPIMLASFPMGNLTDGEKAEWGVKATCSLSQAPHQIYIAGHFTELPSGTLRNGSTGVADILSSYASATSPHTREFDRSRLTESHGLNNIGVYDTRLKRFFSLDQGLDGPIYDLFCDSDANAVYAVGGFLAPVGLRGGPHIPTTFAKASAVDGSAENSEPPLYGQLGAFGGGVAVWKNEPSQHSNGLRHPNSVPGMWLSLPFKGVNGVLRSITRDNNGYFYFGGQFDTTTDGEQSNAPDGQPVNLDSAVITSKNGVQGDQENNIVCQQSKFQRANWLMQDTLPGYWRIEFPFHITPTLLRLWNVKPEAGSTTSTKGTKKFRVVAMPSNLPLNLSYVDPSTMMVQYCIECTLLANWETSQDYVIVQPVLLQALQVDVLSWYGTGGGLGGFEAYQSEIFARGADNLNSPVDGCMSPQTSPTGWSTTTVNASSATAQSNNNDNAGMKAFATHSGAVWHKVTAPQQWQRVIAASISATDNVERSNAVVDMVPYLREAGLYDVYLYTPRCTPTSPILPGNVSFACGDRGAIDVHMYFHNAEDAIKITLAQNSTTDKAEKIYSGMISASSSSFRPHVVVGPSLSQSGVGGGKDRQTVLVDSIQFVKQSTLDNANSLVIYRPPNRNTGESELKQNSSNVFHGTDGSSWSTLPKQLPFGSLIQSMTTLASQVFIAGSFYHSEYSNIVIWDTNNDSFIPLGRSPRRDIPSGLDDNVTSMVLWDSQLYLAGLFQQAIDGVTDIPLEGGLAQYSIIHKQWASFGNVTTTFYRGARFEALELSADDQLIVRGNMTFVNETESRKFAIWDLHRQQWIRQGDHIQNNYPFGQVSGTISYMYRFGLKNSNQQPPTLLAAGFLDSIDSFRVDKPSHIGWLNVQGALGATNLVSDDLSVRHSISDPSPISVHPPPAPSTNISSGPNAMSFERINAGFMFFNSVAKTWHTVVGGRQQGNRTNAGIFSSAEGETTTQIKSFKALTGIADLQLQGEILALGMLKDSEDGSNNRALNDESGMGADLLLLGGAFQSLTPTSASALNGLAIYDLKNEKFALEMMPTVRGFNGRPGIVKVIKSHPRNRALVLAGNFAGIGKDVDCPLVCMWDPAAARDAINNLRDLASSFKSLNNGKSDQVVRGTINDFAFEDNNNMLVVGDLVINGVPCGAASLNMDSMTWTAFGSLAKVDPRTHPTTSAVGNTNTTQSPLPIGDDLLFGPPTAIAHDSTFHRFFVAGKDSFTGAAYFKKWTGTRFIHISADFLPTSEVYQLELMTASDKAPIRGPKGLDGTKDHADLSYIDTANDNTRPLVAARSPGSSDNVVRANGQNTLDPSDTIQILEQGYILLVSGRISLSRNRGGGKADQFPSFWPQEASVAFFDGQSWFPFLQSSKPMSSAVETGQSFSSASPSVQKRMAATEPLKPFRPMTSSGYHHQLAKAGVLPLPPHLLLKIANSSQGADPSLGVRQQGVFRALAFQHLPLIIAREYLALPYVILISIAISLALVLLIVLMGFVYTWMKRRLSKDSEDVAASTFSRPYSRPDSSFLEEEAAAAALSGGPKCFSHYHSGSSVGTWSTTTGAFLAGTVDPAGIHRKPSVSNKKNKSSGFFSRIGGSESKEKKNHSVNTARLMASLDIAEALDRNSDAAMSSHNSVSADTGAGIGLGVALAASSGPSLSPSRGTDRPYRTVSNTKQGRFLETNNNENDAEKVESGSRDQRRNPSNKSYRRRSGVYVEELQRIRRQEEDLALSLSNNNSSNHLLSRSGNNTRLGLARHLSSSHNPSLQHLPGTGATPVAGGSMPTLVHRPNATLAEATGALVSEFVRSHQRQRENRSRTPSPKQKKQQQKQQQQQQSPTAAGTQSGEHAQQGGGESEGIVLQAPPIPLNDKFSERKRMSATSDTTIKPSYQGPSPLDRDSSSSDLLNPIAHGSLSIISGLVSPISSGLPPSAFASGQSLIGGRQPGILNVPRPISTSSHNGSVGFGGSAIADRPITDIEGSSGHAAMGSTGRDSTGQSGGRGSLASNSTAGGIVYYAKYPFRAREVGELGFNAGDKILVVDNSDDIWWMGVVQYENGQQFHGVFPSNYVGPAL